MDERGTVHLLIGPVGAGKTTYAERRVAQSRAVFLDLDRWMVRLFGDDQRPTTDVLGWYLERRERCRALMWEVAQRVVDCGSDVWLELGLVGAAERQATYERVTAAQLQLVVHLLDVPREVRRQRVARRNEHADAFTQLVPPPFFERASDAWEPPTEEERRRWSIEER
ncbi:MAG: ATP-binding protein [Myxococcales bacterium]|nr:ATP-binding protein [Myxococcales bacterium]